MTHFYPGLATSASVVPRQNLPTTTGSWWLDALPDLDRITAHTKNEWTLFYLVALCALLGTTSLDGTALHIMWLDCLDFLNI